MSIIGYNGAEGAKTEYMLDAGTRPFWERHAMSKMPPMPCTLLAEQAISLEVGVEVEEGSYIVEEMGRCRHIARLDKKSPVTISGYVVETEANVYGFVNYIAYDEHYKSR